MWQQPFHKDERGIAANMYMAYSFAAVDSQINLFVTSLQAMSSGGRMTQIPLTVNAMCPSHGPVVQASLTELLRSYQYVPAHPSRSNP